MEESHESAAVASSNSPPNLDTGTVEEIVSVAVSKPDSDKVARNDMPTGQDDSNTALPTRPCSSESSVCCAPAETTSITITKTTTECSKPSDTKESELKLQKQDLGGEAAPSHETKPKPPDDSETPTEVFPYVQPAWYKLPPSSYHLEVLKQGVIVGDCKLNKSCIKVGRSVVSDLHLEHPSVSRFHAVLQYGLPPGEKSKGINVPGFYVYDMESTHGTTVNKRILVARKYCRLHVGHVIKFGASTRLYILHGPEEDEEPESALTVTEMRQARKAREEADMGRLEDARQIRMDRADRVEPAATEPAPADQNSDSDSSDEQQPGGGFNFAGIELDMQTDTEAFFKKDPVKALKAFYDREGLEPEFDYLEKSSSRSHQWSCRIELPVDDKNGKPVVVDATVSGSKKEAQAAVAKEACNLLHGLGVLQEGLKRRRKRKIEALERNDFYESDEDDFLDRTGDLAKKRSSRMKRVVPHNAPGSSKPVQETYTYNGLVEKLNDINAEILGIKRKIQQYQSARRSTETQEDAEAVDALDEFMDNLREGEESVTDQKLRIHELRVKQTSLEEETVRLKKLMEVAKPVGAVP